MNGYTSRGGNFASFNFSLPSQMSVNSYRKLFALSFPLRVDSTLEGFRHSDKSKDSHKVVSLCKNDGKAKTCIPSSYFPLCFQWTVVCAFTVSEKDMQIGESRLHNDNAFSKLEKATDTKEPCHVTSNQCCSFVMYVIFLSVLSHYR